MKQYSAAERRFFDHATVIAAQRIIFSGLIEHGTPIFKLSDIAETASGGTPDRGNSGYFGGPIPWLKSGELNDGVILDTEESLTESGLEHSSAKVFPRSTLLIALYGATVGKTGILGVDAATNQAICAVLPRQSNICIPYLHWFLRYKREDFLRAAFGGAQPNISQRVLQDTLLPIPAIQLQKVIALFLESVQRRIRDRSVPLPDLPSPLTEERGIFSRIEEFTAHVQEARNLRQETLNGATEICRSIVRNDKHAQPTPMHELLQLRTPDVAVEPQKTYQFAGVYSFGRGVFRAQSKAGSEFAYPRLTRVRFGNFVYPKLMAWEGALGIVPPECDGCVVSTEFPVFDVNEDRVLPEVLDTYFRTPSVWAELSGASTGTNVRRRRLNPADFLNYKMPLPSRTVQEGLHEVKTEVVKLERLQAETAADLDALLSSVLSRAFVGGL
jgi:hypothetical protein